MNPTDAVIVSAVRTAVARGKKDGSLANVHPVDLSAEVLKAAVSRAGIAPGDIDDVLWGCAMPEASQGLNVARLSVLRAGFPVEVPATTVNRFCSSGLQTVAMAAQANAARAALQIRLSIMLKHPSASARATSRRQAPGTAQRCR